MDFTAFNEYMVCEDDLKIYEAKGIPLGYDFCVKYPTYRGAYLCNIENLEVMIDGKIIPGDAIRFGVNGKWFFLNEIPECSKEYWFTGTKAVIRVLDENPLNQGEHEVFMKMKHKIPYTGYFGNYLMITSTCTKKLNTKGSSDGNEK
ncbi:Uncharacterised protein [uncultured Roseburia sp.]|uniref:C-deglycosylation enzyme beta subunit n=1 Tax=Brotonthovivens ammoniilytica TaxID=2981725 RepID=A0ABT2TNU1_9FIRM|nr:DUF6379 domain-containing protein [Brotonthovivens ammoniilytica]MCU6763436.1 DUF6379 domain-containing protein [Brotonthovivens ammoniilytica]SCJ19173.1 Uncharacterised protein [uncultured Roseburia sp.]